MSVATVPIQQPIYRHRRSGRLAADPWDLLEPGAHFSLSQLGTMLTNPFLEAEHPPVCPWVDVERVDRVRELPRSGTTSVADLVPEFAAAVRRCIGDVDAVAVMYSGGLDSSSTLVHAHDYCRETGRDLVAITWDITDQFGVPTGDLVRPQLAALGLDVELVLIEPRWDELPEPEWSAQSPRLDYYSRLHQAMVDEATARGCGVILTGIGGDEVLAAWNAMTAAMVRHGRWRDAYGYLKGFALGGTVLDFGQEALSVVQRGLPRSLAFDLYAAVSYREELQELPTPLAERYRPAARAAAQQWMQQRHQQFVSSGQSWAEANIFDAIYPMAFAAHPLGAALPQASPFLDPGFVDYACGLPVVDRFAYSDSPSYHWYKALHWKLLPAAFRAVTPRYKQSYSHVYRDYQSDTAPAGFELMVEHGLIEPLTIEQAALRHARLPSVLRNIETWMRGALERGAVAV